MGGVQGEGGGSGGGGVAWRDGGHRAKSEGALGRRWRSREWRVRGWPAPGEVQHAENVSLQGEGAACSCITTRGRRRLTRHHQKPRVRVRAVRRGKSLDLVMTDKTAPAKCYSGSSSNIQA